MAARAAYGDSLAALADELERERLDALDIDDPTTGVRSVFSWSLRSISEPAARLFVLLGLHPGPDFAVEAAASLIALPVEEARRALRELVDRSLLTAMDSGRFSLHDLLRDYAAERVTEMPEEERDAALRRMLDHYLHTAHACWQQLQFNIPPVVTEPPDAGVVLDPVTDTETAWAVFGAEHRVMLNAVERAEEFGADDFIWKMMFVMHGYLSREGHLHDIAAGHRRGLSAAERLGDFHAQSLMHRRLAGTLLSLKDYDEGEHHLREAIRCAQPTGDVLAEAHLRRGLAFGYEKQSRFAEALEVLEEVHPRMEDHSDSYEVGRHLAAFGRAHLNTGDGDRALELCLRAAVKFEETEYNGQEEAPAGNLESLGDIYLALGRHEEAVESYGRALVVWRQMRGGSNLADCLIKLGKACFDAGDVDRGSEALTEALAVIDATRDRYQFDVEALQELRDLLASVTNV